MVGQGVGPVPSPSSSLATPPGISVPLADTAQQQPDAAVASASAPPLTDSGLTVRSVAITAIKVDTCSRPQFFDPTFPETPILTTNFSDISTKPPSQTIICQSIWPNASFGLCFDGNYTCGIWFSPAIVSVPILKFMLFYTNGPVNAGPGFRFSCNLNTRVVWFPFVSTHGFRAKAGKEVLYMTYSILVDILRKLARNSSLVGCDVITWNQVLKTRPWPGFVSPLDAACFRTSIVSLWDFDVGSTSVTPPVAREYYKQSQNRFGVFLTCRMSHMSYAYVVLLGSTLLKLSDPICREHFMIPALDNPEANCAIISSELPFRSYGSYRFVRIDLSDTEAFIPIQYNLQTNLIDGGVTNGDSTSVQYVKAEGPFFPFHSVQSPVNNVAYAICYRFGLSFGNWTEKCDLGSIPPFAGDLIPFCFDSWPSKCTQLVSYAIFKGISFDDFGDVFTGSWPNSAAATWAFCFTKLYELGLLSCIDPYLKDSSPNLKAVSDQQIVDRVFIKVSHSYNLTKLVLGKPVLVQPPSVAQVKPLVQIAGAATAVPETKVGPVAPVAPKKSALTPKAVSSSDGPKTGKKLRPKKKKAVASSSSDEEVPPPSSFPPLPVVVTKPSPPAPAPEPVNSQIGDLIAAMAAISAKVDQMSRTQVPFQYQSYPSFPLSLMSPPMMYPSLPPPPTPLVAPPPVPVSVVPPIAQPAAISVPVVPIVPVSNTPTKKVDTPAPPPKHIVSPKVPKSNAIVTQRTTKLSDGHQKFTP